MLHRKFQSKPVILFLTPSRLPQICPEYVKNWTRAIKILHYKNKRNLNVQKNVAYIDC